MDQPENNHLSELDEKTTRLEQMLADRHLDAVLLTTQHNFAWLTGGGQNGVDLSRTEGAVSLLVTRRGNRYLLANNIELPRMLAEEVDPSDFEPVEIPWVEKASAPGRVMEVARSLSGSNRIGTDLDAGGEPVEAAVARCRYSLTPAEVERYRIIGADAAAAVQGAISLIAPGMTEQTIAATVQQQLALKGLSTAVNLVAADERIAQFRHPVPTGKCWTKLLMIVVCAKHEGLFANLTRLICVGAVPDDLRRRTDASARVNAALWDATRVGVTGAELFAVAAAAYEREGYGDEIDRHHQGGATGYRTRDWIAHPGNTETAVDRQAFTWNPSITGTKVEETVILRDTGLESITTTPEPPQIEVVHNRRTYHSTDIQTL